MSKTNLISSLIYNEAEDKNVGFFKSRLWKLIVCFQTIYNDYREQLRGSKENTSL